MNEQEMYELYQRVPNNFGNEARNDELHTAHKLITFESFCSDKFILSYDMRTLCSKLIGGTITSSLTFDLLFEHHTTRDLALVVFAESASCITYHYADGQVTLMAID
jgi:hypothetical protein